MGAFLQEDLMGWSMRKSIKLGPARLNLSSRGIGYSVGVRGLRVGTSSRGRSYVRGGRGMLRYQAPLSSSVDDSAAAVGWVFLVLLLGAAVAVPGLMLLVW